jgi:hypothetical protein
MPAIHAHTVSTMMDTSALVVSYSWYLPKGTGLAPRTSAPVSTGASRSLLGLDSGSNEFRSSELGVKQIIRPFQRESLAEYITARLGPKS